jgi:hypothetical protein
MWDEIKGLLMFFVGIPLAIGTLWYIGVFMATGEWPDPPRADCYTEYDGRSNSSVCD